MSYNRTKAISLNGILIALIIVLLYLGNIIKNNSILFIGLAIIIGDIPYYKSGIKYGVTSFMGAGILALLVLPDKVYAGMYLFFGIYPLIKLVGERRHKLEGYLIKYVWFNITIILFYSIFWRLIILNAFLNSIYGKILIMVALQLIFLLFDFIFTRLINFIYIRILKE